ncbi:DUF2231 domain-containing protein [Brevibacillus ginsengisoli]|uniref:DUF2231 domain-containing protein n=1 Tax=Brevibacillus ginsengisoli TaxID=363854 RepID=UPI003CF1B2D3
MFTEMPLHPVLVHFPIALLTAGVLAQLLAIWKRDPFDRIATYLFLGGFLGGIAAYLTGDGGEEFVGKHFGGDLESFVSPHETFALWTLIVFGIILAIKILPWLNKFSRTLLPLVVVLSLVGTGFLVQTGHLGGKIVYQSQLGNPNAVQEHEQGAEDHD